MTEMKPSQMSEPPTKANIVLDASKIDLFETCPQRYNIRYNLKRSLPIHQKAIALDLGGLAHSGLEVYYTLLAGKVKYEQRIDAFKTKIREINSDPSQSSADPEEVDNLISSVEHSLDYWRGDDENCMEVLAVESPFAYVLYEDDDIRIIISGKIDLLANYTAVGRGSNYKNLVIDHKTFKRDGTVLRKSNQFINYCVAAESNYLLVNRIGLAKTTKPEDKYKRLPMSYDPLYLSDWKDNLTKLILNEYLGCISSNAWPEKPTSCFKFNRICEYYDICDSSGQEAKEFKLNNNYVEAEEWDVTKSLT